MIFEPHSYQKYCIDRIEREPVIGLFLDMGLGKTAITLTAVERLINDHLTVGRVLVIAPKRVAEQTWPVEMKKWDHLSRLSVSVIAGSAKERSAALKKEADLYVIGRDNVDWLVNQEFEPYDLLVLDELSSFKNHRTKRFRAVRKLRAKATRVVGLTGTPAPNTYMDLWAQMVLLDRGERLGKSITAFRKQYFTQHFKGSFMEYEIKDGAKQAIDAKLSDLCVSMKAEDYLDLKEPIEVDYLVQMTQRETDQYKQMEKKAVLDLEDDQITAASAAAVSNKLLQMANGAIYDESGEYTVLHDRKLEALEELVEEANGQSLLVAYAYRSDLQRIQGRFPQARQLQTGQDIKDWNAGKIPILLAHPASCGHGLNLQDGGSVLIWFGLPWSLEYYLQTNARLHRQGQKEAVRIYRILTEGTMDEKVLEVLKGKNIRQEQLLAELKAEITGVESDE